MAQAQQPNGDGDSIPGLEKLTARMERAESIEDWSFILQDYVKFGNNKVAKNVAIFNMGSATDCPNLGTSNCQVPKDKCYAHRDEKIYDSALAWRRRQEFLWDCLDPETWAKAFLQIVDRKRNPCDVIRFSESGDFRHNGDIVRVNEIAKIVGEYGIDVYTYSASDYLDWTLATDFTINASNDRFSDANRRFTAKDGDVELSDGEVWCPFDLADKRGFDKDERPKCGECRLCIDPDGPDVVIPLH